MQITPWRGSAHCRSFLEKREAEVSPLEPTPWSAGSWPDEWRSELESRVTMAEMDEQERKIVNEFCHLLEKSKQLFNGLR